MKLKNILTIFMFIKNDHLLLFYIGLLFEPLIFYFMLKMLFEKNNIVYWLEY